MSITLAQAIKNAIAAEQAAEKFYLRLAEGCAAEKGRKIFKDIAAQERNHAATLEALAAKLVAGQLPERADDLVDGIETAPAGAASENLKLIEALEIAIDAENSAILYYDALASTSTGEASAFFERMGEEEEGHAAAIRAMLAEAGAG
ncbi:MAG: ferritin family protein [Deltaproteobacteria bacterium]|jgi:rubrerythrin|nr:ferritin family protein [Deltaproteobacteria bacterium]